MKIKVRFLCEKDMLTIKFNENKVNFDWLEELTEKLNDYMLYLTKNRCDSKFLMWQLDSDGDGITFLVECNTDSTIEELEHMLRGQFRGSSLFAIKQEDLDFFTWGNSNYWKNKIDKINKIPGDKSVWLIPILERVKIEIVEG